jgi:hypothetical protein
MGELQFGYIERPNYDEHFLLDTVGYVTRIWVEQEDSRDQLKFTLKVFTETNGYTFEQDADFTIYLDRGTTVAFAQLQLLRDALESMMMEKGMSKLLVQVHFTFGEEPGYGDPHPTWGYAYWVRIVGALEYPTTVHAYYPSPLFGLWYTHLE